MKQNFLVFLLLALIFVPVLVSAEPPPTNLTLTNVIGAIENIMYSILAIATFLAFLAAAILFLTAGGNASKIQTAKAAFFWGIVGVVVGLLAWSIFAIVAKIFS